MSGAEQSPQDPDSPDGARRLVLVLEYEGTRYKGFQWQATVPTIQGTVEQALERFTGERTRVRGASRTDSGAHAAGQVVDFLTCAGYPPEAFVNALNWHLPPDVRVRAAWQGPLDFNSRFDATSRVYRYTLWNDRMPSALWRDFSHWVRAPLDLHRMREAAGHLPGTHDLSALAVGLPPGRNPVRSIKDWDVCRDGYLVYIDAEADGFLPHQIRRTNGVLVEVGLGRLSAEAMKDIIDGTFGQIRNCPSLPAKGLCLRKVNYPNFSSMD
jgi:tRNA pseudouridine38-40 synthase